MNKIAFGGAHAHMRHAGDGAETETITPDIDLAKAQGMIQTSSWPQSVIGQKLMSVVDYHNGQVFLEFEDGARIELKGVTEMQIVKGQRLRK